MYEMKAAGAWLDASGRGATPDVVPPSSASSLREVDLERSDRWERRNKKSEKRAESTP